ncbi:MAG TPA: MFS transporter, partial [Spirochaetota bacterium]|nr:MFS transporter [Spirochaetota bacterium]
ICRSTTRVKIIITRIMMSNNRKTTKILITLFIAIFSSTLGSGLVVPLLPGYAHTMGASGFLIGMIFGAFSLSRTVMLPLVGFLSDSRGRKPFITLGLFIYFIASVLFIFADNIAFLIIIRFIQGGAAAMILPIAQAYAGDITPHEKEGTVMGLVHLALYGGLSSGPVLGGFVKDTCGIDASFMSMGLICFSGFILSIYFLPPVTLEVSASLAGRPGQYLSMMKDRRVTGLFIFRLAYTMCIGSIWSFAPLIADIQFHMESMAIGIVITLSVLISAVLMTPMGILADRGNKKILMIAGGGITAASMFILAMVEYPWQLYLVSVVIGIGGGISVPSVMAVTVIAGREYGSMASMMSLLTLAHSFGMMAGPVIIGLMMDMLNVSIAFAMSGVLMFIATLLIPWLIFSEKVSPEDSMSSESG